MRYNINTIPRRIFSFWTIPPHAILALFIVLLTCQTAAAQPNVQFEKSIKLKASEILSPDLMKSDLYSVRDLVVNDGLLNHYTVDSRFGTFKANSTLAVKQLLLEINAIAEMKKIDTTDTAIDSVVQSGKNTVDAVANLVTDPQETLEGAVAGVSSLFNRAKQVVGKRKTTDAEDNQLEQVIGKSKSKGNIANKFGVSVYSPNQILQEELERLAWADYLGGIGVGLASSAVSGVGGLVLSTSGAARLLNEVINTTPASELWVRNKNKLVEMEIDEDTVQLYLNNPSFSPALQTVMVEALAGMNEVANRSLFIKIALQANTQELARTITEMTVMIAGYHKKVAPIINVAPFGRFLYSKTKTGTAVLIFPADHILWSERVADSATWLLEPASGQTKPTGLQLWVLGNFSTKAQTELQTLGWELHENVGATLLSEKKPQS
ncbi:MAG: hypothetical protein ACI8ZB_004423 [Desulforhopalus sp.]|jgi:hypothetical protein